MKIMCRFFSWTNIL